MSDCSDLIVPVILAGGTGTRLWPLSRSERPKQFLRLTNILSPFQLTLARVSDPDLYAPPIIVTNDDYRFLVTEQVAACRVIPQAILLEPEARNTAPAITAACRFVANQDPNQVVHVLPADHQVETGPVYFAAVGAAMRGARAGRLVTFGVPPTEPSTAFGYIAPEREPEGEAVPVDRFVEKPAAARAAELLAAGGHYWNSGMFVFTAAAFLAECEMLAPRIYAAVCPAVDNAETDLVFLRLDPAAFGAAPAISADYAIFEKTGRASMVRLDVAWSDLGAWDGVWKAGPLPDTQGNVAHGPAHLSNTSNSLIVSERDHVVVDGLDDVAVIASEDAIFVGRLSNAQSVGDLVKHLKADPATASLTNSHRTTYRPWGGYTSVVVGERFQVKRLFVNPGSSLSLQKHHHRAEHWIVVRGTAEVILGNEVRTISENESVYLRQGTIHRLTNPGKITLELIEVQTGSYLGEDDIIRYEDDFGRV